jgi:hypothetical protein
MSSPSSVRILRQREDIDVEDLRTFLTTVADNVTVEETYVGPQTNVDWFLPPVLTAVFNYAAAHPFLMSSAAGWASGAAVKVGSKLGDEFAKKAAHELFALVPKLYKRAKAACLIFIRGEQKIPVPPLALTFEMSNPDLSRQSVLTLVFPDDLEDAQLREALRKVDAVIAVAKKRDQQRADYENNLRQLIAAGKEDEAMAVISDEESVELRRSEMKYVYRPAESAWIDAWELAIEPMRQRDIDRLKDILANPPETAKGYEKEFREMLADLERKVTDARVR